MEDKYYELLENIYKECRQRESLIGKDKEVVTLTDIDHYCVLLGHYDTRFVNNNPKWIHTWRGYKVLIDENVIGMIVDIIDSTDRGE